MKGKLTILTWLLIAGFFVMFSDFAGAQDIEFIGSHGVYEAESFDVNNDHAFIGSRFNLFTILNITDKNNPTRVFYAELPVEYCRDVKVMGNYLYISGYPYFTIFDISDIENPTVAGACTSVVLPGIMDINENYAYVACYQNGLKIIDISNPANPSVIWHYDQSSVHYVSVTGNYAYVQITGVDIKIFNIVDPTNPILVATISTLQQPKSLCIENDLLFVTESIHGFTIIDISNPPSPFIIGHDPIRSYLASVQQDFAFIGTENWDFAVLDVSDPANPYHVLTYDPDDDKVWDILQRGYYTYIITDDNDGIFGIYRFTGLGNGALSGTVSNDNGDPLEGTIITAINTPFADTTDANGEYFMEGFYTDLHDVEFTHPYYADTLISDLSLVTGDTVVLNVVLEYPPGIDVGVSSIINPVDSVEFGQEHDLVVEVTNHGFSAQTFEVYVEIYYADSSELLIADTTTVYDMPAMSVETVYFLETFTPERFKSYDVISYTALPGDEVIENDTSFAICHGYKSYPPIQEISSTWFPYSLDDIYIRGNYAYITTFTSNETIIIDITNRYLPFLAGSFTPNTSDITGSGNYLYCQSYYDFLLAVYDISSPTSPFLAAGCTTNYVGSEDIVIEGNHLYVAQNLPGISIYDISNPLAPVFVSNLDTPGLNLDLCISGNYVYISDYYSGQIADISNPISPFITGSFTIPSGASVCDISVSGDYAYVPDNGTGLLLYDVSDPYNPNLFATYGGYPSTWFIEMQNEYVYLNSWEDFIIFDASDPDSLILAAIESPMICSWTFSVAGDYIYLSCGRYLKIYRFPVSASGNCYYASGDVNNSGDYNGLDVTYAVAFFKGGPPPPYECECTPGDTWYVGGDVNGSCSFNGLDVTYSVAYFKGGPAPFPCADCPPSE